MSEGNNRKGISRSLKMVLLSASAAIIGSLAAAPAAATDRTWLTAVNGNFTDTSKWSGGAVPGAADNAIFDKAGTYTVHFTTAPTNTNLTITNGTLSLDRTAGSGAYTLSGSTVVNTGGIFNLLNGISLVSNDLDIASSGSADMVVDGSDVSLTVNGTGTHSIGLSGNSGLLQIQGGASASFSGTLGISSSGTAGTSGSMQVFSGATVTTGTINIANFAAANSGSLTVSGADSVLTQSGASTLTIGAASLSGGSLSIINGGTFNTGTGAVTVNDTGVITITNGFFNLNGNATFNAGTLNFGGGEINVAAGKTLTMQSGSIGGASGGLILPTGTMIVDASTFNLTGTSTIGRDGGTAVLTYRNGSTSSASTIALGGSGSSSNGTLNVEGTASLTTGALQVGTQENTTIRGAINSSGTITVASANTILIGAVLPSASFFSPTGTVNITAGTFHTGTGATTVQSQGQLNITGGTFDLNGPLTVSGHMTLGSGASISWPANPILSIPGGVVQFPSLNTVTNQTINLTDAGSLTFLDSLNIRNGATVQVLKGSQLSADHIHLGVPSGGDGTLIVDGPGSSATAATTTVTNRWGTSGNTANVTFRNSATGQFDTVFASIDLTSDTTTNISVQTGASLTLNDLALGDVSGSADFSSIFATLTISGFAPFTTTPATVSFTGNSPELNLGISHATVNVLTGGRLLNGAGTTNIWPNGLITINGGEADLGTVALQNGGGIINFVRGSLTLHSDLTVGGGGLLGDDLVLGPDKSLTIKGFGSTTIASDGTLTINGGSFSTTSLSNSGSIEFTSGSVAITNSGISISSGGALGSVRTLVAGQTMSVNGGTTSLDSSAFFTVDGGNLSITTMSNSGTFVLSSGNFAMSGTLTNNATGRFFVGHDQAPVLGSGAINNFGRIELEGGAAKLGGAGAFSNNAGGFLTGDGEIVRPFTNAAGAEVRVDAGDTLLFSNASNTNNGAVNINGGTADFGSNLAQNGRVNFVNGVLNAATLTNAPAGIISGHGSLFFSQCTNNGQIQLSSGLSDFFGALTNNSGSKVFVTGGGTATFHGPITHNAGAEIRVSVGSVAAFLDTVSGAGTFSGAGTKIFEAGSPILSAVETSGDTIVEPAVNLTADHFRENSLTVNGAVTLASGGGTTHLNGLFIAGSNDNWSGILDVKNNSLVLESGDLTTVTNQIKSGLGGLSGIASTAAGAPFRLGSMSNSNGAGGAIYSSFQGIAGLDGDEVLVRYTRIGDLNLDGTVSISDFIDLASHFNTIGGATWQMGDLNYDGSVSISDFIDLASNFGQSVSGKTLAIGESDAAMLAEFASSIGAGSAVPEPSTLLVLAISAVALFVRKRTTNKPQSTHA